MMRKYSSFMFAVFAFVIGIMVSNFVSAATSMHKVSDTTGTVTRVELTNVDLNIYSKYNAKIQSISNNLLPISSLVGDEASSGDKFYKDFYNKKSNRILAKASPGSTISIRITPELKLERYFTTYLALQRPHRIANNKFELLIKNPTGFLNKPSSKKKISTMSYTIPGNADFVYVCWCNDYADPNYMKFGNFTIRQHDTIKTEYYIFTSDEAFKKAYKIWTGQSLGSNITVPAKSSANNPKSSIKPQSDGDEGGIGLVEIGGAAAVIGAGAWAASHFFGGGGASGEAGASGAEDGASAEPETFIYTDPATGAQSLYEKDPDTGQWVNPQTGGVLDMSDLGRFTDQRGSDRKWMNTQMNNLGNRNTAFDTDLKNDWQNMLDEDAAIDQQGRKDKLALKTGTYGMTDQERNDFLTNRQNERINDMNKAHQTAKNWDTAVKTAEVVQTAADIGVDTLATVTAPVGGGVIADVYAVTKNVAGSTAEAVAEGKNVAGGFAKGLANGAVDVWQNHAGSKWNKAASLMGGETFKSGLDAGMKGESVVIGAAKGFGKGITKFGIDKAGEKIGKAIENSGKNSLTHAYNHARDIRTVYSKDISQKSVDTLKQMNIQKHLANMQKANHQSMANTITNATARNTLPNGIFGE